MVSDRQLRRDKKEQKEKEKEIKSLKGEITRLKTRVLADQIRTQLLVSWVRGIKHGDIKPWCPAAIRDAIKAAKKMEDPKTRNGINKFSESEDDDEPFDYSARSSSDDDEK